MKNKGVVLIIAFEGFQPIEYRVPKQLLEQAGYDVITASNQIGEATGGDGSKTLINILVKDINPIDYDGLFFIGGPGALQYLDNETSYDVLRKWKESEKPYGAICISPRILIKAGVLENKKVTGWNGDSEVAEIFKVGGAIYVDDHVVVDGNIVTADGPAAAEDFAKAIMEII